MKLFLIVFYLLVLSLQSFSQKDAPIHSHDLAASADELLDSGEYKKALAIFEQIDRNDSNYARSVYGRALSCQGDSQFVKAIHYCEEALQLKDRQDLRPKIYNTYANLLDDIGDMEKSLAVFDEGIKKYPAYSNLYYNKGITLFNKSRFAEAENVLKESLLINPYLYNAHFYLGLCAIHQGKLIPAFLSFMGYMLLNPGGKFEKRCVNIMSVMANVKDEVLEFKTKQINEGDENFSMTEDIFLSKIALEKGYNLSVSLDDPIFRQMQVVCEKLEYKEDDPDFWMQYYVPFYKKLFSENDFEPYIYWSFQNVQLKEIQDYNRKNKKLIENLVSDINNYFNTIRSTRVLLYNKRAEQVIQYLYENGELAGRGRLSIDGRSLDSVWTFYYPAGNLKGNGSFHEGKKYGEWTFYYFSGSLQAKETYENNKLEGRQIYYSEQGLKTDDQFFQNGLKNGLQKEYYINGNLSYSTECKSGKPDGIYKVFYPGGQIKTNAHQLDGKLSGPFENYYENEQISETGSYKNGALEGPYKQFHENGQLSETGSYQNNLNDGEWKNYYDNGKLKSKTVYINGNLEGIEELYDEDGSLSDTYSYKKGVLDGEALSYNKNHKLYARFQFSNSVLQSVLYFDNAGKQLSSSERINKRLDLKIFLPDGTLNTERTIDDKGQVEGKETVFFSNGKVKSVTEHNEGAKNGQSIEYYLNGRKKAESTMKNGKPEGYTVSYYPNGNIQVEGWLSDGQPIGYWNYYDYFGRLTAKRYFVDGIINGYQTDYYPNGKVAYEKKYYHDVLEDLKQFDTSGKMLIYDSFPQFTGKASLLYPDGRKLQEYNYVNGNINGPFIQYYPDGSITFSRYFKYGMLDSTTTEYEYPHIKKLDGYYKAGKRSGLWKYYDSKEKIESTEIYSEGELDGPRLLYATENNLTGKIPYRHGKRNGESFNKDPDSSLLYTVSYCDGTIEQYSYLDKDGKPVPGISGDHGELIMKSFFQNGKPSRECTFADNLLNGLDRLYYETGKLRSEDHFEFGVYEGQSLEYYSNGNLKKICNYQNDDLQGSYKEYNDRGQLLRDLNYNNGLLQGEAKYYSDAGTLVETRYYYNGLLLSVKK
jgi:antitoxin component YwqK of YwqJK toxin-antitoxin module/Tfp pilus assembly protein PilF